MTTHFITAEIDLQASPVEMTQAITAELQKRGEPLRWAVTAVNAEQQTAIVEAVVVVGDVVEVGDQQAVGVGAQP
jgi:predicted anti-sigma-YlaC factor YlaD